MANGKWVTTTCFCGHAKARPYSSLCKLMPMKKRMPRRPEGAPGIRKLILAGPVTWTEPCQE